MSNVFYAGQNDYIEQLNSLWDRATISVIGTSTSSLTVSVGSKTFTTNTNLQFAIGSQVTITATGDLSKYMSGQVTTYNQTTGDITVNVTSVNGIGTFTSWSISLSGQDGVKGDTGDKGLNARGVWSGATSYLVDDWVTYNGSSYYRKIAGTTGTNPASDTTNWGVLAQKGDTGSVSNVTATTPLSSSGGGTPNITIQVANTSQNGYLSNTDWNTFNGKQAALGYTPTNKAGDTFTGNVGIGASNSATNLYISRSLTGATTSRAVVADGVVQSDATASAGYFASSLNTAAATFTVPFLTHFSAQQGTIGVGSVVTNQYGFSAASSLTGATNNYGFHGSIPAAPNNWNLYMFGAAKNYMAGNLLIGSTTDTGEKLQVTGNTKVAGTISISSNTPTLQLVESDQTSPDGRHRLVGENTQVYFQKNTAVGGDYSTSTFVWGTDTAGGLITVTPATASNNTRVATAEYVVNRIALDAVLKTGNSTVLGTITATNLVTGGYAVGYLETPQNTQSSAYTSVLSDAGKHIYHPSADTTARTFTIPANASVAYPIGTTITFINDNAAGVISIAITTDTMRLAGAGTTGTRTLAANGVATAIKLTATSWIISGTGLT